MKKITAFLAILPLLIMPLVAQKYHAGTPYIVQQDTIKIKDRYCVVQFYRVAGSMDLQCRIVDTLKLTK